MDYFKLCNVVAEARLAYRKKNGKYPNEIALNPNEYYLLEGIENTTNPTFFGMSVTCRDKINKGFICLWVSTEYDVEIILKP